ncbi:MAG: hypothetical protein KatS3mg002_0416 [Candidatus Woesearchaeota archaeon]|nr:MAG: hypothetical protein KatS3mg002_0416 [Candidatus Woesearchaeota archaeon]
MNIKEKILQLYPEFDTVYGPYIRKDQRQHYILYNKKLKMKKTVSYSKILVEINLGRKLVSNETVDHIDGNVLNNDLSNLRILDRKEHIKIDVKRRKPIYAQCMMCGKKFEITRNQLRKDRTGVFCSRQCSGKYGSLVRSGKIKKFNIVKFNCEYYSHKVR